MVLRASGSLPGNTTASHEQVLNGSISSSPYTGEASRGDWGLWWRSFSARCRWLDPSNSKFVGNADPCSQIRQQARTKAIPLTPGMTEFFPAPCSNSGGPMTPTNNGRGNGTSTWRSKHRRGGKISSVHFRDANCTTFWDRSLLARSFQSFLKICIFAAVCQLLQVGRPLPCTP